MTWETVAVPRAPKKRPKVANGFLRLDKQRIRALDDLPAGLWKVYIKLLTAASWAGNAHGVLGFAESPWTLHDIATATGIDDRNLCRDLKRLSKIGLSVNGTNYGLVWHGAFDGYAPCWYLPHYGYFTGDDE